NVNR
ncbi:hypothetical protein D049_2512B, partial [Vibrio parahaemolyticus VPTS-2010]